MARQPVKLTHTALVELGPDRLASLLIEHAATDKNLEKKLKLALAASQGSDMLMSALAKRIQGVRQGTKFIEWNEAAAFADELDQIRTSIIEDLAPEAPRSAADLLADFVHASDRVYGRADDSSGRIGDVFHLAVQDWGRVWSGVRDRRPEVLAGVVLHEFEHDNYGLKDGIIPAFADALGPEGLDALTQLIRGKLSSATRGSTTDRIDHDRTRLICGLTQVADAKGDPDAFVAAVEQTGFPERRAIEIAARMLKAGRPAESLQWLDRWDGRGLGGEQSAVNIRIAALTALERQEDAQAVRWDWVAKKLSLEHFRDYVRHLSTETAQAATVRVTETAAQHEDVLAALQFLVGLGATAVAGQIILKRLPDIDGRWYHDLRPIAKQLATDQPLAAVVLYRVMAEAVLKEARSKHYSYAAKDVLSAGQIAEAVTDWKGHGDHAAFVNRLRQ